MGFGKSFDEAFRPANAAATAGAMDILKERIKANNETALTNNFIDMKIAQKIEEDKKAGIPPEQTKENIKIFEKAKSIGLKTEHLKSLFPDETLTAQRESTTALNNTTRAIQQLALSQAGVGSQPQKPQAPLSTIAQVAGVEMPQEQPNTPIATKVVARGTELVLPENTKKVEEMKAFAGAEGKYQQEKIQAGEKIFSGIRSWGKTMDQFEQAFPTGDKTPLAQRISAVVTGQAVKLGLMNEPQLLAAQKSLETGARQALKDWGDKGALSNRDVDAAVRVLDLSNLTLAEKMAVIRGTSEKALASLDDETLQATFQRQPYMKEFIDAMGIKYGQESRNSTLETAGGANNLASQAASILAERKKKNGSRSK